MSAVRGSFPRRTVRCRLYLLGSRSSSASATALTAGPAVRLDDEVTANQSGGACRDVRLHGSEEQPRGVRQGDRPPAAPRRDRPLEMSAALGGHGTLPGLQRRQQVAKHVGQRGALPFGERRQWAFE
jgi:hypothetical protein